MNKVTYLTWYEFKEDLQKEVGRSILNRERIKWATPGNTVYSGTKAFLKSYSQSLYQELIGKGIKNRERQKQWRHRRRK